MFKDVLVVKNGYVQNVTGIKTMNKKIEKLNSEIEELTKKRDEEVLKYFKSKGLQQDGIHSIICQWCDTNEALERSYSCQSCIDKRTTKNDTSNLLKIYDKV